MSKWLLKKLLLKVIDDFEKVYRARYELTKDDTMRPDLYQLQKYLRGEL